MDSFFFFIDYPLKLRPLGGFSTVGVCTVGLVNTCVFGFGTISSWILVGFCHAQSGDGGLAL